MKSNLQYKVLGKDQYCKEANGKEDVVVDQIWLHEPNANIMQITELDLNESDVLKYDQNTFNHTWNYVNNDPFRTADFEGEYKVNNKAKEKRRLKNKIKILSANSEEDVATLVHTGFSNNNRNYKKRANGQINCFTIINKHLADCSSTDSEIYNDDQNHNDTLHYECNGNKNSSYDEVLTYDANMDTDKHTILIYSYKNHHLFSDTDVEIMKISSKECSSTSSSIENIGDNTKDRIVNSSRIPTPIPETYVPRLNFSIPPSLPTVTEINESTHPSNETLKSDCNLRKKIVNNWFTDIKICMEEKVIHNEESLEKSNILNWMALSPRQKRRTFKNTVSHAHLAQVSKKIPEITNKTKKNIDYSDMESSIKQSSTYTAERILINEINNIENINLERYYVEDRGDHVENKHLRKPHIKCCSSKYIKHSHITDPIEKLNSDNWILDDKLALKTKQNESNLESINVGNISSDKNSNEINGGSKLWINNMSLLKPAEWSEYIPIVDSVTSLNFSLEIDSLEDSSCFSRLFRCYRCCN
ncbi:uncharacterized protein LOC131854446 isoform X2 [Achroia grisella]|uniref:uncharacterized protein LOC131854446 isoform X2 n=1 Tax=Achroia grisella TaxID=688607 RepID=UPI0027D1F57A|nr:uncharacterized protein LOC131854446 isoform X2 [Achroia grisella]